MKHRKHDDALQKLAYHLQTFTPAQRAAFLADAKGLVDRMNAGEAPKDWRLPSGMRCSACDGHGEVDVDPGVTVPCDACRGTGRARRG